jgi:hypothetical protein
MKAENIHDDNFQFREKGLHDRCSPATLTPEAQIKPQSKRKLTLYLALTHTYIVILIYVLTLTHTRAYTLNYPESKCRWEQQSCYRE